MIGKFYRLLRDFLIIKRSGLFDRDYYLVNNPDVRNDNIDPLIHFIKKGWKEGRNPCENFSIDNYLGIYSDVRIAKINPFVHYLTHGRKEGRLLLANINGILQETLYASYHCPYNFVKPLKDIDVVVISEEFLNYEPTTKFSFVTTVFNEENNILDFLHDIRNQTYLPNDIIIVDGGSTDGTVNIIEKFINGNNLPVNFIKSENRINIAEGRNIGIKAAIYEVILFSDAGCKIHKDFCKNLVGTSEMLPDAELIGGIYFPLNTSIFNDNFIPDFENYKYWEVFLPSSRALLVRKKLAVEVGLYPEYLTLTGEDTLFDLRCRAMSTMWAINTKAYVCWSSPTTLLDARELSYSYSKGDGESGLGDFYNYHLLAQYFKGKKINLDTLNQARWEGYLDGRNNRSMIEIEKRKIKGVVLMLAGVPITDSGGGQRSAQLSFEFIEQGFKVIYINLFHIHEPPHKYFLNIDFTLLELYDLTDFNVNDFIKRYQEILDKTISLIEFPHEKYLQLIRKLKKKTVNIRYIYDYIDNWQTSLGALWYSAEKDKLLLKECDFIITSAKSLKEELSERYKEKSIALIPNAVNAHLFDPGLDYKKPDDLNNDKPIVMYIGAMWGEWFNWDLVEYCIGNQENLNYVFLGSVPDKEKNYFEGKFSNVSFLGIKQQSDLPAYLSFASVCIIPFKDDHITRFVNPLKVYEYLAMEKSVVASNMGELKNIPNVYLSSDEKIFLENINSVINGEVNRQDANNFLMENNWRTRVKELLEIIQFEGRC